jgi:hypothetical protein
MEVDEEEAPPLLVDTEANNDSPEDRSNIKVPITIVTGNS